MAAIDPAPQEQSGQNAVPEAGLCSAGAAPGASGLKPPRVLIVDDDAAMRTMMQTILGKAGYEVECFASGTDVLRSLKEQPADLLITDIFMPGIDGMELLMALRHQVHRPRVIAMSGGNRYWSSSLNAAEHLGAVASLPKPFSLADLLGAVRAALAAAPRVLPASSDGGAAR